MGIYYLMQLTSRSYYRLTVIAARWVKCKRHGYIDHVVELADGWVLLSTVANSISRLIQIMPILGKPGLLPSIPDHSSWSQNDCLSCIGQHRWSAIPPQLTRSLIETDVFLHPYRTLVEEEKYRTWSLQHRHLGAISAASRRQPYSWSTWSPVTHHIQLADCASHMVLLMCVLVRKCINVLDPNLLLNRKVRRVTATSFALTSSASATYKRRASASHLRSAPFWPICTIVGTISLAAWSVAISPRKLAATCWTGFQCLFCLADESPVA